MAENDINIDERTLEPCDTELLLGCREVFARRSPHVQPDAARAWGEWKRQHISSGQARPIVGKPSHGTKWLRVALGIAASLLLLVGAAELLLRRADVVSQSEGGEIAAVQEPRSTAETSAREVRELTLADGTHVWLADDSRLTYPVRFQGARREVELRGEAYFKVAHDARHPFTVKAGSLTTEVLGTEFNIRARGAGHDTAPHVTLIKGSVRVCHDKTERVIRPGEDATPEADGTLSVRRVDTARYTSWRDGLFYFDDETVGDVARELGRWYAMPVRITSPTAARPRVHLVAKRGENVDEVLRLLSVAGKVRATSRDGAIVVE